MTLCMLVGIMPMWLFVSAADVEDALEAALEEALAYTDAITINNSSNDPATVVKNFNTHFTWDNEKRESSKSYLFDWSYYNGVVFEGIEYLYEVTGDTKYRDYVVEYMSSLIAENGTWAKCTNNTSKECAGYNSTHGADCYKTASLLLDTYEMTGDSRYLTMAATLYADLDTAAKSYSLGNAGNNFRHTWSSDPSPDLWLDGLYMILPFRAEYAKHINDTEELDLIVSRMKWVSDNMYNSSKGLFYHAADSSTSNSGTYWLRSIGWYAAAIVDIMDSMEGDNFTSMQAQLVKLVDGMKAVQNSSNGMWLNNMAASQSSTNPYETSGTALVCYAVMKAVNNGWLDESYADMALLAFKGICSEKLSGTTLTDICFKGAPGSSNSTFYDNEGKGVGPFIMLTAEIQEYVNAQSEPKNVTHTYADYVLTIQATALDLEGIDAENVTDKVDLDSIFCDYVAYDITLDGYTDGDSVEYSILVLDDMDITNLALYAVDEDGEVEPIDFELVTDTENIAQNKYIEFTVDHDGTFAYGALNVPVGYTLNELVVSDVEKTKYFVNDSLDLVHLTVTAVYVKEGEKDFTRELLAEYDYEYSAVDMTTAGTKTVTLTFEGKTASYEITVYEKSYADSSVSGSASQVVVSPATPGMTGVTVSKITSSSEEYATIKEALADKINGGFVAYSIEAEDFVTGTTATVTMPIPTGMDADKFVVYYVADDGCVELMNGKKVDDNTYSFTTTHFSTYVGTEASGITGKGALKAGTVYKLDTDGVIDTTKTYLIVNTGSNDTGYALQNNNGSAARTPVTISDDYTITIEDDSTIAWQFSGTTRGTVSNNGKYLYPNNGSLSLNDTGTNLTISNRGNGAYRIYRSGGFNSYYLTYSNSKWTGTTTNSSVYLYEYTSSSSGDAVEFTIVPGIASIRPGDKLTLTGTVTVGVKPVELDKCTISWASDNTAVATVEEDGIVTGGNTDGEAKITATLTAVNGTALEDEIKLTIPVTVQSKTVVSAVLSGNTPVSTPQGEEPDFSNIKLSVTYDDGTTAEITADNGLIITDYYIDIKGLHTATISYAGKEYGNVIVNVTNDFNDYEDAEKYPEYPEDGAVRLDKTATGQDFENTGVVKVELDVAGISVKKGVDVVLVADISNSMAWKAGEKNTSPGAGETTKWQDLQASAGAFIDILLAANEDESENTNTVSFVMFGGYDADRNNKRADYSGYFDATRTVFTSLSDATAAKAQINAFSITGTDSAGYTATINGASAGTPQGGTNYDYAFLEAASAIEQLKSEYATKNGASYDESGREIYVVFMTDGAPDHYNQLYYKSRNSGQFDYNALYRNSTDSIITDNYFTAQGSLPTGNFTQHVTNGYYMPSSGNVTNANWITWLESDSLYVAEQVLAIPGVNSITSIGFDLAHGAFSDFSFEEEMLEGVLGNLAGKDTCDVFITADADALNEFYSSLATKIRYAGMGAEVKDTVDERFTLQMLQKTGEEGALVAGDLGFKPTIDVILYDLYVKGEAENALVGTRKDTTPTVAETVYFNDNGTEAYSTVIGANTNIMTVTDTGYVIAAKTFTYIKDGDVETITWNIGNITDKEIALSYYAYLKGSMLGQRPRGVYYTNESAYIDYIDINNRHAHKEFPKPGIVWGGATTAYEFYLVNDDGKPCDRNGNEIPFANRIIIKGPYYVELNLNADDTYEAEIIADNVLPNGYVLYDTTSKYYVLTTSGDNQGSLILTGNGTREVGDGGPNYVQSRVAFAVIYNQVPDEQEFEMTPDSIVIDFGLDVVITGITENNTATPSKYTSTIVGLYQYTSDMDLSVNLKTYTAKTSFEGRYGTFTLNNANSEITYSLKDKTLISGIDQVCAVIKLVAGEDELYMLDLITVIPATTVYYEESFLTFKDSTATSTVNNSFGIWNTIGTTSSKVQTEDRPGFTGLSIYDANNIYGYDPAYDNFTQYSLGSAKKVTVDTATGKKSAAPTATFTFTGTGFDIISITDNKSGVIMVTVKDNMGNVVCTKSVHNYYGYAYDETNGWHVISDDSTTTDSTTTVWQVPVIKIDESDLNGYSTYSVEIKVAYLPSFDLTGDSSYSFWLDAIRIYDPAKGNTTAEDAYSKDNELNPYYTTVRDLLVEDAKSLLANGDTATVGAVFIDGKGETFDIADYANPGPNHETYLAYGQGVSFKLIADKKPTATHIGVKLAYGDTATLKIGEADEITVSTATDMYYELPVEFTLNTSTGKYETDVIVLSNGSTDKTVVLSITNIKSVGVEVVAESTNATATTAMFMMMRMYAPVAEPDPFVPETFETSWIAGKAGKISVLTVTTSDDVASVTIDGNELSYVSLPIIKYENWKLSVTYVKVWMYTVKLGEGTHSYELVAYDADGLASEPVEAAVTVVKNGRR